MSKMLPKFFNVCKSVFPFRSFKAESFPLPAKALTESQPVNTRSKGNALHTSGPSELAILEISMQRISHESLYHSFKKYELESCLQMPSTILGRLYPCMTIQLLHSCFVQCALHEESSSCLILPKTVC